MNQIKSNRFFNLIFFWLSITFIYVILILLSLNQVAALLGLFVPLGFYSIFILLASPLMWVISLIFVLLVIFGSNYFLNKRDINLLLKVIIMLLILFILTILVDIIIYGSWESLNLLKNGGTFNNLNF